jgi:hypothetical protein
MRLHLNEVEYELEKDIKEFAAFERPGRGATARVRKSPASRSGYNAAKRDRDSRRSRKETKEEGSL